MDILGEGSLLSRKGQTSSHEAFGWAYYHFILNDGAQLPQPFTAVEIDPTDYSQLALGYALATVD